MRQARRVGMASIGFLAVLTGCESMTMADRATEPDVLHAILVAATLPGLTILLLVMASIGRQVIRHQRAARRLRLEGRPAIMQGHRVALVSGMSAAAVAGIVRPTMYCADDLHACLDNDALRAVLSHEDHHRLTRAPAQLIILAGADAVLGRIPLIGTRIERARAEIEIAADAHAIQTGSSRPALARAILLLRGAPAGVGQATFGSSADLRIRALLGDSQPRSGASRDGILYLVGGAVTALTLCSAILAVVGGG